MARTTRRVPIVPPDADDEAAVAAATALAVRRRLLVLALVGPGVGLMVGLALRRLGGPSSGVYDWLLVALAMTAAVSVLLALRLARGFDRQVLGPARAIGETIARASAGDRDARTGIDGPLALERLARRFDALLDERAAALDRAGRDSEELNDSVIEIMHAVGTIAARKDLTLRIPVTDNVTGAIADALNLLTDETRRVLANVRTVSRQVAEATVAVKGQSDSAGRAAAREQREVEMAALELAAAAAALHTIAARARAGGEAAERAEHATAQAMATVAQTEAGVVRTRELIRGTEKRIKRLGERSQEVGQAVGIVQAIAERTAILALNASMHAAAAGEAGRSFAGVADEVKRLSESVREATLEIGRLVTAIQTETHDTVIAMNHAIAQVVEISRLAEDSGRAMQQTQEQTQALAAGVRDIAQTALEQARVGATLQERAQIIQEASSETTRQLTLQAAETQRLVASARALLDEVGVFRVGDGDPR